MCRYLTRLIPNTASKTSVAKAAGSQGKITTLDGLRGLACLFVLHEHWTTAVSHSISSSQARYVQNGSTPLNQQLAGAPVDHPGW
jgi:peptidoglycan/LPS O-acetylase OafA/YrhL